MQVEDPHDVATLTVSWLMAWLSSVDRMRFVGAEVGVAGHRAAHDVEVVGERAARTSPARTRCRVRSPRPARRSPGTPQWAAVRRQSSSFWEPPPTMWTTSTVRSVIDRARSIVRAYPTASDSTMQRGDRRRVRRQRGAARSCGGDDSFGHVAGCDERRVVDVDGRHGRTPAVRRRRAVRRGRVRLHRRPRCAWHSCSSQSPPTLRRNLVRPPTPPSLVKFASRLASVTIGSSSSRPTSDHVPLAT